VESTVPVSTAGLGGITRKIAQLFDNGDGLLPKSLLIWMSALVFA
jgi:hypothetical protein